jgi:hypothetical protein
MSQSKPESTWICHATGPLDSFQYSTLSVFEWIERGPIPAQWSEFLEAVAEVTSHPLWEWQLRHPPCVGYDPVSDSPYFIFKIDNNGLTFVVSQRHMPELAQRGDVACVC